MKAQENTSSSSLPRLRTEFQREKEAREMEIYREYTALASVRGQSITAVTAYLMRKHGIHSASTIYEIRRRVEARLAAGEGDKR